MSKLGEIFNPYREKIFEYPDYIKTRREILTSPFVYYIDWLSREYDHIILEIGSGSGNHLIELAKRHPKAMVVGMELRYKRIVRTAQKAKQQGIQNLCVLQWDGNLFHTLLRPEKLDAVYLNFPDPWSKKKHQSRRIFLGNFLERLHRCLCPGGFFSLKTDHGEYFQNFLEVAQSYLCSERNSPFPLFLAQVTWDLYRSPWVKENIPTEFEMLFLHKVKEKIKHCKLVKSCYR